MSHTTESSGERELGGVKVKNLPDYNPDKPEGKAAKTSRQGGWMKKPESQAESVMLKGKNIANMHTCNTIGKPANPNILIRTRSTTQTCIS